MLKYECNKFLVQRKCVMTILDNNTAAVRSVLTDLRAKGYSLEDTIFLDSICGVVGTKGKKTRRFLVTTDPSNAIALVSNRDKEVTIAFAGDNAVTYFPRLQ